MTRGSVALLVVILAAAGLRLPWLDFDLPEVRYIDGPKFTVPAVHMLEHGDLRPIHFQYPGLYSETLALLYRGLGITTVYGRELTAAAVAAAAGIAVVPATAAAAAAIAGRVATLIAAALVAAATAMVTQSRTPAPDTLCILFMTLAVSLAAARPTGVAPWAAAGVAGGLAAGSKWTGLFAIPVLVAIAAETAWRRRSPRVLAAVAAGLLLAFLATTPFIFHFLHEYASEAAREYTRQRAGQIGRVQLRSLDYMLSRTPTWEMPWLGTSLPSVMGWPGLALAAGGIALAATGRLGFAGALYAATAVAYVASISGAGRIKAVRFLLPVVPLLAALAGACAERLLPRAWRERPLAWVVVVLVVAAQPLAQSIRYVTALRQPSTNARARDWLRAHVAPGAIVFVGPFFTEDLHALPFQTRSLPDVGERLYGLPPESGLSPERYPIYTPELVDALAKARVEYVVLNSYFDGAFAPVPENRRFFPRSVELHAAFTARLAERADLVHEEIGWRAGRIGPDVQIWRLRDRARPPGP